MIPSACVLAAADRFSKHSSHTRTGSTYLREGKASRLEEHLSQKISPHDLQ